MHDARQRQNRQRQAGAEGTTMQELRFVAVSEDGRYAVLAVPGRSARFTLPIDERLRAVAQGQTSRLAQYEIEVESPLRPKEIQARIRAGETVEEIADAAGIAIERVRWFEGPVLAERAYVAEQAQAASVRRQGDATPGPRLGEIVAERLSALRAEPDETQWDAKKRGDGSWQVELTFVSGGRPHTAEWLYDQRRRHVLPADDNAVRMSLPGSELPEPATPNPGEATVTQLAPRLSSAVGHGGPGYPTGPAVQPQADPGPASPGYPAPASSGPGYAGNGNSGRHRNERPAVARPAAPEPVPSAPSSPAAQAPEPRAGRHSYSPAERPPAPERPAAQVHGRAPEARSAAPDTRSADTRSAQSRAPESRPAESRSAEPRSAGRPESAGSRPGATPASVAAQVSKVAQAPRPARDSAAERARVGRPPVPAPEPSRSFHSDRAQRPDRAARVSPGRDEQARRDEQGQPAQVRPVQPPAAQPPAARSQAAPAPVRQVPVNPAAAEPEPEPAAEQASRPVRKAARGKRSSVPSWDEIMFGNRRD